MYNNSLAVGRLKITDVQLLILSRDHYCHLKRNFRILHCILFDSLRFAIYISALHIHRFYCFNVFKQNELYI
jgi:hypothetical protein